MNKDDQSLPTGLALTPLDDCFRNDPYPVLGTLREQDPVHHDEVLERFVVTRYDDVQSLLRAPDYFTDPRKAREGSFSRHLLRSDEAQLSMLLLDDPEHRRLRGLVNRLFSPTSVRAWLPRIAEIVEQQLARLPQPEFDLIGDYAAPIPTIVIAEIMGIPAERHGDFRRWSDDCIEAEFSIAPSDALRARGEAATRALQAFLAEQLEQRRRQPGDDLISQMLAARFEDQQLTDLEIINQCELLLIAGNTTTSDLIANGVKALLEHPEQLALLRSEPTRIEAAVEEMLRFDAPVTSTGRITPRAVCLGGRQVGAGESLTLSLAAANRDPAVFPEPERFDITRNKPAHQSFGGGRHHCLGAWLARAEARQAILGLLQHFSHLDLSDRGWEYAGTPAFRGMTYCWLQGVPA